MTAPLPDGPLTAHLLRMQEIIEGVADMTSGGRAGMEAFLLAHAHHALIVTATLARIEALQREWHGRATEATSEPLSWRRVSTDLRTALVPEEPK